MSDSSSRPVVMIVEDDRDVRESMAEVLEDSDYEVVRAAHGAQALEQLRTGGVKPCVILLDIMMPVMDAWQFRAEQTADPALDAIPVVVLSAHARMQQAAAELKVTNVLEKPVRLETLLAMVKQFCGPFDCPVPQPG